MKRFLLTLFIVFSLCIPTNAEYFSDVIVTSPNAIWTDSRTYATLNDALTAIGGLERDLYIAREETIITLTIPSNIRLHFLKSGAIANSGQLTINTRQISAKDQQIFTGTGDIDFAVGSVVRSSWFSNIVEAFDVTADDELTLVISKSAFVTADCAVGNDVALKWESPRNQLTANVGFTLSNIKNISAGNFQLFAGAGDFDFLDGTKLKLSWFKRLRSAITWIENEEVTLEFQGSNIVSYSDTIQANITLMSSSGVLVPSGGVTLTFNTKSFIFPNREVLLGAGSYNFASGTNLKSTWFVDFEDAIAEIGTDEVCLEVSESDTITNNTTVDANTTLNWTSAGNVLSVNAAKTLTIYSPENISAGPYQIKSGSGAIAFTIPGVAFPEWVGAVGDGVTDDSSEIQELIDALTVAKGGTVQFMSKDYKCNLEIKSFVSLLGSKGVGGTSHIGVHDNNRTTLTANATGYVVDTPVAASYQSSVEGINFIGLGVGTACVGMKLRNHHRGTFRDLSFDNFADQAVLVDAGNANEFTRIFGQDCILNTTRAAKIGILEIGASSHDNYVNKCEFAGSSGAVISANLYICSILIKGSNNSFVSNIGEYGEVGIRIESQGVNRFANCRADLNWGHGWEIAAGNNQLVGCTSHRNSQDTTNTYDGFYITGLNNMLSGCLATSVVADAWKHRYGFNDTVNIASADRNTYSACKSIHHTTGWFSGNLYGGSGPEMPVEGVIFLTDLDTTPSVELGNFFLVNYTVNTTITDFDDPVPGQKINLLKTGGAGTVTFSDAANIVTNTDANKDMTNERIYTFRMFNGVWYEVE